MPFLLQRHAILKFVSRMNGEAITLTDTPFALTDEWEIMFVYSEVGSSAKLVSTAANLRIA